MFSHDILYSIFLVFAGAAVLSTVALYTRQSLLVAYVVLGILIGPWGLGLITNIQMIHGTGEIGILFLLFLLGLHLHPQNLLGMFKRTTWVTLLSSFIFFVVGALVSYAFGYSYQASLIVGAAMMFSSTIIGLKLMPTTALHHQQTGEIIISVLLLQDLLAIAVLLCVHGAANQKFDWYDVVGFVAGLPGLLGFSLAVERYILRYLFERFDRIREYIFLLAVGWCLTVSVLGSLVGLSFEIGAFLGGVSIAANPLSFYIAESLRPVRDFFLVMFFFAIGAGFNLNYLHEVIVPAAVLAATMMVFKPLLFNVLLRQVQLSKHVAWEVGIRLGQVSEFSILVAYVADHLDLLSPSGSYFLQATTILTFFVSSYVIVMLYPTPLAMKERMRRD